VLFRSLKGTKEIPFTSIAAIQFKEAGMTSGYLQFTILGGIESRGGILAAARDENTFMFAGNPTCSPSSRASLQSTNAQARKIKEYIDAAVNKSRTPQAIAPTKSLSEELQGLVKLREQGALSEEEFQVAKKKLIS
jgi:hypothetical protein